MHTSDQQVDAKLAQSDAAPQRGAGGDAAPQRGRGPHPLPALLALLAEVCGDDRARLARVLAGVRAYQAHEYRRDLPALPIVATAGGASLRDYGGAGPVVVVVPSLINPPWVLDLAKGNSLLRWLATQGVRPLLVDWGPPGDDGFEALIEVRLVPLVASLGTPVAVAGYCLGGTLALMAAARLPVTRLALLATPWRFAGYADRQRADIARLARGAQPLADALGCWPMDLLQPGFWALDPAAVVAKFERFATLDPASPVAHAFVALEDWANDGPPLSRASARDLFALLAGGTPAVAVPNVPILDIVATRDRIVPPASASGLGQRLDVDAGHVGMVVGSRARGLLREPLARFLRGA